MGNVLNILPVASCQNLQDMTSPSIWWHFHLFSDLLCDHHLELIALHSSCTKHRNLKMPYLECRKKSYVLFAVAAYCRVGCQLLFLLVNYTHTLNCNKLHILAFCTAAPIFCLFMWWNSCQYWHISWTEWKQAPCLANLWPSFFGCTTP